MSNFSLIYNIAFGEIFVASKLKRSNDPLFSFLCLERFFKVSCKNILFLMLSIQLLCYIVMQNGVSHKYTQIFATCTPPLSFHSLWKSLII